MSYLRVSVIVVFFNLFVSAAGASDTRGFMLWRHYGLELQKGYVMAIVDWSSLIVEGGDPYSESNVLGVRQCISDFDFTASDCVSVVNRFYLSNVDNQWLSPAAAVHSAVTQVCTDQVNKIRSSRGLTLLKR